MLGKRRKKTDLPAVCAVIVAAGSSRRMGGENKLLLEIDGVPVLARTLSAFQKCAAIRDIVLVCREQDIMPYTELAKAFSIDKLCTVTRGGETRTESVLAGITAAPENAVLVAVHDGARPLVSEAVITEAVTTAAEYGAAAPVVPVKDSIKRIEDGNIAADVARNTLAAVQTPQVFRKDLLRRALTDERVVLAAHIFDDRLVELVARNLDRGGLDDAAERDDRDVGRAAADVNDQIAVRPADVETRADGRRNRLLDEEHALRTGLRAGVDDRTFLDLGDDRGHADDDVRLEQAEALYLADELLDHQLGHLVVRNDALAQRTDGDDVVRRAAEGLLRLRADRHELSRHLVHRDDGRLVEHDALALHINENGRRAEINADVARKKREVSLKNIKKRSHVAFFILFIISSTFIILYPERFWQVLAVNCSRFDFFRAQSSAISGASAARSPRSLALRALYRRPF